MNYLRWQWTGVLCTWFSVRVALGEGKAERTSMQERSETNLQLWSVRESISRKNFANKVTELEEWLLAPP
jgi:hypothetical protein